MNLLDLSPWDQLPYITTYKETPFGTVSPGTQLAAANNQRIAIGFSLTTGGTGLVISNRSGTPTGGILISSSVGFLWMTSATHSILPTLQWFGQSSSTVTVIELIAAAWPKNGDNPLSSIDHPPVPFPTPAPIKQPGVNNDQGVLSYWRSLMQKIGGK